MAVKLSALRVKSIKEPGRYGDGNGLYLIVSKSGSRKWVFRFSVDGRVTEMGLGSERDVSLADAREKRDEARKLVRSGINPIEARRSAGLQASRKPTFGEVADEFIEAKSPEWRNPKHRAQWKTTLETYAAPLRRKPVDEVDTDAILAVLRPIWKTTQETASRLRGRIEAVLDAARARGYIDRNEANPARWRGHLDKLLPKRQTLTRGHHAAMPFPDIPEFIQKLRERDAVSALALEFTILTAARSGEVFGAVWPEIDLNERLWTIPAQRMKAGREHRIPLSDRALEVLQQLNEARPSDYVFPGQRPGKPLSGMAMEMLLRRMNIKDATVHGFRSGFRDWAGDKTDFPGELAEAALAHVAGDKTFRAYRRADALEKRRELMQAWADFCSE